ncbi:hypothetical protein [Phytoactinopolyspora mesophila]|nr:hypothetical protein [Phytoactinopolyspora mesophila]
MPSQRSDTPGWPVRLRIEPMAAMLNFEISGHPARYGSGPYNSKE